MRFMNWIKGFLFLFFYWSRVEEKEGCGDGESVGNGPHWSPFQETQGKGKRREDRGEGEAEAHSIIIKCKFREVIYGY